MLQFFGSQFWYSFQYDPYKKPIQGRKIRNEFCQKRDLLGIKSKNGPIFVKSIQAWLFSKNYRSILKSKLESFRKIHFWCPGQLFKIIFFQKYEGLDVFRFYYNTGKVASTCGTSSLSRSINFFKFI